MHRSPITAAPRRKSGDARAETCQYPKQALHAPRHQSPPTSPPHHPPCPHPSTPQSEFVASEFVVSGAICKPRLLRPARGGITDRCIARRLPQRRGENRVMHVLRLASIRNRRFTLLVINHPLLPLLIILLVHIRQLLSLSSWRLSSWCQVRFANLAC
jgi:hypothetical protein